MAIWLAHTDKTRTHIDSLTPYLRIPLDLGVRMDATLMKPQHRKQCPWIGYGILKGVTHPKKEISVIGFVPSRGGEISGLHGALIQSFSGVDSVPQCYDKGKKRMVHGFGGFIRWVYFSDPEGGPGVFGIDFSLALTQIEGVAISVQAAAEVMNVAIAHGIPKNAQGVLLRWNMCPHSSTTDMCQTRGFLTVRDWTKKTPKLLTSKTMCPRCGLSRDPLFVFCVHCGCRFGLLSHSGGVS